MWTNKLHRRSVLGASLAGGLALARAARAETAEMSLTEALRRRRSTRIFTNDPVDEATVAALVWAGQGVNRPESGLRTAPSWHGAADTRLHVADGAGVRRYDPASDSFTQVVARDIRSKLSPQPFVATAPVVLIYVSDATAMPAEASDEEKATFGRVDAAIVAQNVYLFCASRGLGACLVGGIDAAAAGEALGLGPQESAVFVQPVGWPA